MNYYRRYVGDFQRKTMRLDPTDVGIYDLLLDYYYAEEQPIPLELDDIYSICKATKPEHRKSVAKVLGLYFQRREDGYHNKRADEEIAVSRQARANGKHGGRKKTEGGTDGVTDTETEEGTEEGTGSETGEVTEQQTGDQTETPTGEGGGLVHPPTTNLQPSNHQPPAVSLQPPETPSAPRSRRAAKKPAESAATWAAYSDAYRERWGVEPVRNAKINSQLSKLVERLGNDEAPKVAAFYLQSNRTPYVVSKHAVDLLIRDAEGLRTEWATRRTVTETEARQADRTQANGQVWGRLIEEAEARERGQQGGDR